MTHTGSTLRPSILLGLVTLLLTPSTPARAAEDPPWAVGVSATRRAEAQRLVREGTAAYEKNQHAMALARYREALGYWDHPAIRYDLAECLINLDRPVEAHLHLLKALRYGAAPFDARMHAQAQTYLKLLEGRLGHLTVRCREPGTVVTLDGKRLFEAPGETTSTLMPGDHQLVAAKPGYLTVTRLVVLAPARRTDVTITPMPIRAGLVLRRRFAVWKPWTVIAAGAVVTLLGIPLVVQSAKDYRSFDRETTRLCPEGCTRSELPGSTRDLRTRAAAESSAAIGAFSVGGAILVTGAVLALLNLPRARHRSEAVLPPVTVRPVLGPGLGGVAFEGRF
jgi:hypothetical protein